MSIFSRIAAAVITALVVVLGIGAGAVSAAPASPEAQPRAENCTDLGVGTVCIGLRERAGSLPITYRNAANEVVGNGRITTYTNTRTKHLEICDTRGDNMSPAIWIDPLGAGPPDTILYFDGNGSQAGCLNHAIGYDVRKWSPAFEQGGVSLFPPVWTLYPFPPCPPCTPQ
jgi:hypothetical protein